jgi:hypothetical protein
VGQRPAVGQKTWRLWPTSTPWGISYITSLAMSTAPVKVVQSLARHSTPTLGLYAHVHLFDQTSALDALPGQARPTTPKTEVATLAVTGTHSQHNDV